MTSPASSDLVCRLAAKWSGSLAEWAIPAYILDRAPRSPWEFPPALFARVADQALIDPQHSVTRNRAIEELPEGGTVLDVGVGAGAGSLPLCPRAGHITGVDDLAPMLEVFAGKADALGVAHREILGRWPDTAPMVAPADVVVCTNIVYNVADLVPFIAALTDHAYRRVVVELTAEHPTAVFNPLWLAVHGIERPTTPTAADFLALLEAMGLDVECQHYDRTWTGPGGDRAEIVAYVSRRLCLGPERASEIDALLGPDAESGEVRGAVTAWWTGTA